ncbi:MAG: hypothetical protein JRI23_26885, partial [Deltaproteobacteria bacterium]|nr:hypothetical protein [Deltaproteobacteria bacterium]MBW2535687.1 hypothetical protein [Deltaproteobacteria bacterium]
LEARLIEVEREGFACRELDERAAEEPLDAFAAPSASERPPVDGAAWLRRERRFEPSPADGIRVNIAPLQRAGVLAGPVLPPRDVERAIADRARWRAAERRWCREGKQPAPSWWSISRVGRERGRQRR